MIVTFFTRFVTVATQLYPVNMCTKLFFGYICKPNKNQIKMKTRLFIKLLSILSLLTIISVNGSERTYPEYLAFRVEQAARGYDVWESVLDDDISGVIRKYISEEVDIAPQGLEYINRFAKKNPEYKYMLHLNAEGRQVMNYPEVMERFFPGHWVYQQGTTITEPITTTQELIKVLDARPFHNKKYIDRTEKPFVEHDLHVVIVPLDERGNRDWYKSEFCIVKQTDLSGKSITLNRGAIHSTARKFERGAYIAPVAATIWGSGVVWYYNLSSTAPRDREGKSAADIYVDEISKLYLESGSFDRFNGIALDVNYFDISQKGHNWDVDNDGKRDGGWIGGENVWREGDFKFLTALRSALGDDVLISCDAHHSYNQQCVALLNGMESEGFVQHDDAWRGFSRTVNTHLYWQKYNTREEFRYIVVKYKNAQDLANKERLTRFATLMASCLEAYVTQPFPTYKMGKGHTFMPTSFRKAGSFGRVDGDIIRLAKESKKQSIDLKSAVGVNCEVEYKNGELHIQSKPNCRDSVMVVRLDGVELPEGDATLFVRGYAATPLDGFAAKDLVPRMVWLRPSNTPKVINKILDNAFHNLYGLFATNEECENSYYFRDLTSTASGDLEIKIEGRGAFKLTAIDLHRATDIIVRKFENALVLANPSTKDQVVEFEGKKHTIPAVDAVCIKR